MLDNDGVIIREGYYTMSRGLGYYHIKMDSKKNPQFSTDGKKYNPLKPRYARGLIRLDHTDELVKLIQSVDGPRKNLGRAPQISSK